MTCQRLSTLDANVENIYLGFCPMRPCECDIHANDNHDFDARSHVSVLSLSPNLLRRMDVVKAVETYISKLIDTPNAIKVLLLDSHTVC
jgi:hypothetical protein